MNNKQLLIIFSLLLTGNYASFAQTQTAKDKEAKTTFQMIRRNEEASVYMGLGLAIPHGTEDAKRDVKRSGIIVMQYPDGVEFNGGTAQLVIGIAGVGDEHLEILGQITEAVTEEEILEELKKTTDVDYILNTFTN